MSFSQERQLHRCCCWLIYYYPSITIDTIPIQNYTIYDSTGTPTAHYQRLAQDHTNDWWYPTCTCLHVECRRRESAQVTWLSGTWDTRSTLLSALLCPDDTSRGSQTTSTNSHLIYSQRTTNQFSTLNKNTHKHIYNLNLTLRLRWQKTRLL